MTWTKHNCCERNGGPAGSLDSARDLRLQSSLLWPRCDVEILEVNLIEKLMVTIFVLFMATAVTGYVTVDNDRMQLVCRCAVAAESVVFLVLLVLSIWV